jgi:hypothetical protein
MSGIQNPLIIMFAIYNSFIFFYVLCIPFGIFLDSEFFNIMGSSLRFWKIEMRRVPSESLLCFYMVTSYMIISSV